LEMEIRNPTRMKSVVDDVVTIFHFSVLNEQH
jgi:hypothetical protein